MKTPEIFLQEVGLSQKEGQVYLALLRRGPSSVRQLAEAAEINRGTTYDILKSLQEQGLVSFYEQEKKSYFVAEDPQAFQLLLKNRQQNLKNLEAELGEVLPEIQSLAQGQTKPIARYFQGYKGVARILEEVLDTVSSFKEKEYLVYSSSSIAENLYKNIPNFTKRRVKLGIKVKVLSLGGNGQTKDELAERKSLDKKQSAPTYIIIYGRDTAFISLNDLNQPQGVIIQDPALAQTQKLLFQSLWETLN